jgi:hypothetical protein
VHTLGLYVVECEPDRALQFRVGADRAVVYGTACEAAEGALWMGPFAPAMSAPGQLVTADDQCIDELIAAFS